MTADAAPIAADNPKPGWCFVPIANGPGSFIAFTLILLLSAAIGAASASIGVPRFAPASLPSDDPTTILLRRQH